MKQRLNEIGKRNYYTDENFCIEPLTEQKKDCGAKSKILTNWERNSQ